MPPPDYDFRPMTRDDFPLIRRWLAEPHVRAFWGAPEKEIALLEEDMAKAPVDHRIVSHAGRPFAFIQDYPAHHWPMPHYAPFPEGSRAIDTFIGEPAMLGQGHASGYLRQRAEALLAQGYPAVVIDPSPKNERALRAYRRAGFRGEDIHPCEDGDPVIVMEFRPT